MKKIMIALAVALTAGLMQAASLTWSISNVRTSAGEAAPVGWYVAIFDSGTTFDYEAAKAGTLTSLYSSTTEVLGTTGMVKGGQSGVGSYSAGDSVSAYAVVFNSATIGGATEYIVSAVRSATVGSAGANITLNYGNMAGTVAAANGFYGQSWTAVPEPTSGLLMLVGLGALALRRRRA